MKVCVWVWETPHNISWRHTLAIICFTDISGLNCCSHAPNIALRKYFRSDFDQKIFKNFQPCVSRELTTKICCKISPEAITAAEPTATFSLSPLLIHTDIATLKKAVALRLTNKRDAREKGDKEYFHSSRKYREISWDDDDDGKFMYYIRLHM